MIVGNDQEGDDCVITAHVCNTSTLSVFLFLNYVLFFLNYMS